MVDRVALLSLHSSPLAAIGSVDAGGMNVYVRRLADGLSRLGMEVDVFTRRTDTHSPSLVETDGGARIVHLSAGPPRNVPKKVLPLHIPALTAAFASFVSSERAQYDVVHSHYWLSGLVALRSRSVIGAPVIHMFHTLSKAKSFYFGGPDAADSALRPDGERLVLSGVDAVVGATEGENNLMKRMYGIVPSRFTVISPGVDLDIFRPRDKRRSKELLGLSDERMILFVGRLDRIKGLDVLLHSVSRIVRSRPSALKVVVVSDQADQQAQYQRVVARLGLDKIVDFQGIMSQQELALYYSAADICAVPSAYESFGMVAVEAMACHTPVVGFSVGGLAATIDDNQTGFLAKPGDLDDYTSTLERALDRDDLPAIGRRARQAVEQYKWPRSVESTAELYDLVSSPELARHCASGAC